MIVLPLASAQGIRAGAAQSLLTPELVSEHPVYLAGFGHNRIASGVHDDLSARCLALGIRKETLVICSADLIGLFYDDVLTIRRIFQQSAPAPSFLVVASGLRLYFLFFGLLDDSRFLVTYSRTAETELNLNTETLTRQLSGVASEPQEDSTQSRSPTRR